MEYDLGHYSRTVTTASPKAQHWFDQGLAWLYGFNHEEAITCFEAARADAPTCAMAHWGIAYAIGPNYNRAWDTYDVVEKADVLARAHASIANARDCARSATPVEAALIEALATRYPDDPSVEDFAPWNDAYANAMRRIHAANPGDPDVCALFAEAMMNRTPWALWDLKNGTIADGADTAETISVIETALEEIDGAWDHAGLLHLFVHVMEMSPHPERALRHGDRLRLLMPDSGHLLHMPTHIDVLCGDYQSVVERNDQAIIADRKYYAHRGGDNFYTFYRCHNYHFKAYGAMFLGQPSVAHAAADELVSTLSETALRELGDFLECFVSIKQHVHIRFGQWTEIIEAPLPKDAELYAYTTTVMHYARAVAFANLDRPDDAEREKSAFLAARTSIPDSLMVLNNTSEAVLQVAEQMMLGEMAYHSGQYDTAFEHLRRSVALDDALEYDEPWGWMQPSRHALGALLLEQGHHAEAEEVYRADLGLDATLSRACQHPGNVWAMHGLHECLTHRGETVEARHVKLDLDRALGRAEIPIRASCFCRGAHA